ncbi:MAG: GTP cyclohydrolase I FolE2 [Desulfofustis sp.]|nr:GTP cyclohydrolase I FolE2 [Desulfofustis sp.]
MKDIQNQQDYRRIDIKKVGVKTVTYPITVLDKAQSRQKTIATINMYVNLPHRFKGTHMSRFIEILNYFHGKIDIKNFHQILEEMKRRLNAEAAHMEMVFPFFLRRNDGSDALRISRYECTMSCFLGDVDDLRIDLAVPISYPPAEDGSAERGGLWGTARVSVRFKRFMWLEDLIDIVEATIKTEMAAHRQGVDHLGQPMETLLERLDRRLSTLTELRWYEITVENLSRGYSLFAATSGPELLSNTAG